jgi:peptidoglycan LD-endopeptidase CwlK
MISVCCQSDFYVSGDEYPYLACHKCHNLCAIINTDNSYGNTFMPRFSQRSFSRLATCHPDLQTIFYEVIKYVDCTILEGHRGQEAQDEAFKKGNSKLMWPNGKHNTLPSMACDVAPYPVPDWNDLSKFYWFAGFVMGVSELLYMTGKITHKVRFGGDWNRNYSISDEKGLRDLVHYEIKEI